ncbi:germin-like protein subfamily 1 member 16 [Ricinus communis]|uniref:germin-like protein subfamily 1 member 16 n=1 Tax=Ricinus communis TaxID=3988 RepID=UPI000772C9A9|nr:germin-like protein subfamily 1 member 16 [Ricinus communis]|eukprot:XP_015576168.1 germin-like protein subfamily 1 member 16 [Ricinus communis]
MEVGTFLLSLLVFAMASSFCATAFDPSPLQDFCVATDGSDSSVFVNGKFCKNPNNVTADDFFYSGLNVRANTSNQLGVNVTILTADVIPGLNTNGITLARIDYAANGGLNPPHVHPRAAEILVVLEGTVYAGFVTSNPDHRLFSKILKPGDVFVFPFGMIHFQLNLGKTPALAFAALTSQNPGVMTLANGIFGAHPSINLDVVAKAFHLDKSLVRKLRGQEWANPS